MFISQSKSGRVFWRQGDVTHQINGVKSTYEVAQSAIDNGTSLANEIVKRGLADVVDLRVLAAQGELDCPLRHPDPAHMFLTGTGLTHLGSASTRNAMHDTTGEKATDSMKMFQMGIDGGKPQNDDIGAQPEWFYKGSGVVAVAPGDPLFSPDFALDGGEEPEIAGLYLIANDGRPFRLGFALSNEFSDHVTEKINYLYLAHSKLRPTSFGPEIRVGALPQHVQGVSKIERDGKTIWKKPFLSGEANMSHYITNLEHHHFKYDLFRQPGDVHVHMFGTATLSFADKFQTKAGDVFHIESEQFGLPLRNSLEAAETRTDPVEML